MRIYTTKVKYREVIFKPKLAGTKITLLKTHTSSNDNPGSIRFTNCFSGENIYRVDGTSLNLSTVIHSLKPKFAISVVMMAIGVNFYVISEIFTLIIRLYPKYSRFSLLMITFASDN